MVDEVVIVVICSHTVATQSCYTGGADCMNDFCSFAEDEEEEVISSFGVAAEYALTADCSGYELNSVIMLAEWNVSLRDYKLSTHLSLCLQLK